MKVCDLHTGTSKLEEALQMLRVVRREVAEQWNDETFCSFSESYLDPLEPKVQRTLDAVQRLAEVLIRAEQECGSY